jgi:hypothetical protein
MVQVPVYEVTQGEVYPLEAVRVIGHQEVQDEQAVAVVIIRNLAGEGGSWQLVRQLPGAVIEEYVRTQDIDLVAQVAEQATPPRPLATDQAGPGEVAFVARPGEGYDLLRFGELHGRPQLLRLVILDQVELHDLVTLARKEQEHWAR